MKKGTCIKCNTATVYKRKDGIGSDEFRCVDVKGTFKSDVSFDCYVCSTCGYFENYITESLEEIAKNSVWKRVEVNAAS
jgi:hypothetical protein